jgi:exonuclease III
MLARRRVDICCIQEVSEVHLLEVVMRSTYKFWYSRNEDGRNVVGILMQQELAQNVMEVVRNNDRMMRVKMVLGEVVYEIFSLYALQGGETSAG